MQKNFIRTSLINHFYQERQTLKNINLNIDQGDIVVMLGSSGSGKSTLLNCLNLLTRPISGQYQIGDLSFDFSSGSQFKPSASQLQSLRKRVGKVFQSFNLWPHLTVEKNLSLAPIQVLKKEKNEVEAKAHAVLAKVGLADKLKAYPHELSGGQQQRVAIGRALMMEPDVLLFDEPTSALDPENVKEVLKVMQSLAEDGITMLVATHEIGFAKNVATHALFLEQGQILEQGLAKDILNKPETERLRCFLDTVCY